MNDIYISFNRIIILLETVIDRLTNRVTLKEHRFSLPSRLRLLHLSHLVEMSTCLGLFVAYLYNVEIVLLHCHM